MSVGYSEPTPLWAVAATDARAWVSSSRTRLKEIRGLLSWRRTWISLRNALLKENDAFVS
jgi:hypothetical protein